MTGITSTGFVLKILPADVEIFRANIVYVKTPELPSSNRIGRFGVGMSQNTEEAGKKEERRKYANERSPLYWLHEPGEKMFGKNSRGKKIFPVSAWRIFPDELHTGKEIPVIFFFQKQSTNKEFPCYCRVWISPSVSITWDCFD